MARMRLLTGMLITTVLVSAALMAYAQGGPGRGRGRGVGCPAAQCGLAQGGCAQAGWWTKVKAQTPAQQAFINDVAALHDQIRAKILQLATLQAGNASQSDTQATLAELNKLRTDLKSLMTNNARICKELGVVDCSTCTGCWCGCCDLCACQGIGRGLGLGIGGWWNRVQPQTDAERAFVADVKSLHDRIAAAQTAGDQALVESLRTKLHDLMYANQALHQQLLISARGTNGSVAGCGMSRARGCGGPGSGICCGGACPIRQ